MPWGRESLISVPRPPFVWCVQRLCHLITTDRLLAAGSSHVWIIFRHDSAELRCVGCSWTSRRILTAPFCAPRPVRAHPPSSSLPPDTYCPTPLHFKGEASPTTGSQHEHVRLERIREKTACGGRAWRRNEQERFLNGSNKNCRAAFTRYSRNTASACVKQISSGPKDRRNTCSRLLSSWCGGLSGEHYNRDIFPLSTTFGCRGRIFNMCSSTVRTKEESPYSSCQSCTL